LEIEEREKITVTPETKEDKEEVRKLNNKYLPYKPELCQKTLSQLQKFKTLDGNIPDLLIEHILGDEEKNIISTLGTGQDGGFNKSKIKNSWNACVKNNYRDTIRDIQSVEITLITDEMDTQLCKFPYCYQSLGMYKWSFVSWLNKIKNLESWESDDWLVKKLEENTFVGEIDNDEEINFQLSKVTDFKSIPNQVYVNAKYFGYDPSFGFNWQYERSFGYTSPRRDKKHDENQFKKLTKDTFYQHNRGLIGAFEKEFLRNNKANLDFTFKELAKFIEAPNLTKDDFIRVIYLMILLHDYGKLNDEWQKPMQRYQAIKENATSFNEVLAHTDYDSKDAKDKILAQKASLHKRPPHAGVGAFTAQQIIPELFEENDYLKSGVSMAIARHHSPLSIIYPRFQISESNYQIMKVLLDEFNFDTALNRKENFEGEIDGFEFDGNEEYLLYFFFVRLLRLCDQKAKDDLKGYFND